MTINGLTPEALTVMFATRGVVKVFCVKFAVIVPLPVPEGVTVHQVWSLNAVQLVLEVTAKEVLPAGALTDWFDGATLSVGVIPACVTVT